MSAETEGFICPYCLVGFGTSSKLQGHFVEMHSGQGSLDEVDSLNGEEETSFGSEILGHEFKVVRQNRPKTCDGCGEIIWHDALVCQVCQVTVHEEACKAKLSKSCSNGGDDVYEPVEAPDPSSQERRTSLQQQAAKGILPLVRRQIAKGRDRYVNEEFDLDLTYITERIIAMSFPATGVESAYRNNLKDVAKMLKTKHEDNYMIFNLSERSYDISRFNNQVLDFGWPDHLAPSLERLSSVCKSIKSWLDSDLQHVAVVHCKGGKGRTGCVIAAFMHYSEICHSAAAALDRFAMKRFYDNKLGGVTQPSQRKYVHYFADLLSGRIDLKSPPVVLQHVLIHGIPNFDSKGGCRPFLKVYENMKLVYTSGLYVCNADKERVKITVYGGLKLQGEVLVKCHHKKVHTGIESIFRCQFHTAIVGEGLRLVYSKSDLDDAFKDKRFGENIRVELLFETLEDYNASTHDDGDIRISLLEAKKTSTSNSNGLGDVSMHLDPQANRNSYIGFRGGFDNGMADEGADEVPDLISLESPTAGRNLSRDRSVSNDSFKMDPEDIERIAHPSSDQVYTVVNRSPKPTKRNNKTHAQSPPESAGRPSSGHLADRRQNDAASKRLSSSNVNAPKVRPSPRYPPPPPPNRKPPQLVREPPNSNDADEHDYSDVPDEFSSSSPEPLSPVHQQTSPTNHAPSHSKPIVAPRRSKEDLFGGGGGGGDSDKSKPRPPSKPAALKKPAVLGLGYGAGTPSPRPESPVRLRRSPSPHRSPLSPPSPCPLSMQPKVGSTTSPEPVQKSPTSVAKAKPRHRPSYAEINPDQEIQVEPVTPRMSATDNDMWVKVRYNSGPPHHDSLGRRSSSSSNLSNTITSNTGSDYYSNLAEIAINVQSAGSTGGSSGQRRHSFTEGEENKLIIKASAANRDSIIPLGGDMLPSCVNPDYKNVGYDEDGQLNIDGTLVPKTHSYENQVIPAVGGRVGRASSNTEATGDFVNEGFYDPDMDYMNQDPEGLFHTYTNQDDLLEQMRAENKPVPSDTGKPDETPPTDHTPQVRGRVGSTSSILRKLMEKVVKPKQPQTIHSGTISEEERHSTLAPFTIPGIAINKVNRDYEAFFKTAWGSSDSSPSSSKSSAPSAAAVSPVSQPPTSSALVQPHSHHAQAETDHKERPSRRERKTDQPSRPPRPSQVAGSRFRAFTEDDLNDHRAGRGGLRSPPRSPQLRKAKELISGPDDSRPGRLPSPPPARRPPPHRPLVKKPSAPSVAVGSGAGGGPPLPAPRQPQQQQHSKLTATNSDASVVKSSRGEDRPTVRKKVVPPPKPPPYFGQQRSFHQKPSESTVKAQMPYWYRPQFSREEAINFVRGLDPGSFIVRDSMTVQGGYAITIKISHEQVRQRRKISEDSPVTEDMLVTHFLIQPDPEGVKLQGWSERPFKTLPEFIAHHTVEKLCLPCKLVLPQASGGAVPQVRRKPAGMRQALQSGAACDLVYLGSVEVSGPGNEVVVMETVEQLKTLGLSTMNIVTFKASTNGITLTDDINGLYIKRQYPITSITYCGLDSSDTRWDFPNLQHLGENISLTNKPCFGVVLRPPDSMNYTCLVFAEFDSAQPVTSVVNYVQRVMRNR